MTTPDNLHKLPLKYLISEGFIKIRCQKTSDQNTDLILDFSQLIAGNEINPVDIMNVSNDAKFIYQYTDK